MPEPESFHAWFCTCCCIISTWLAWFGCLLNAHTCTWELWQSSLNLLSLPSEMGHKNRRVIDVLAVWKNFCNPWLSRAFLLGWIFPCFIELLFTPVFIQRHGKLDVCFLTASDGSIWAFAAPALFISLVNLSLLCGICSVGKINFVSPQCWLTVSQPKLSFINTVWYQA